MDNVLVIFYRVAVIAIFAYVVFMLGHSGWWWLLALLLLDSVKTK